MAQLRWDSGLLAQRCSDGVAGDERELRPERHRRPRMEQDREEQRPSRRRLPRPPEPASALRLEVGCRRRAFGFVRVEQALRRRALLDEAIGTPQTPPQQRLDRARREIRHPPLDYFRRGEDQAAAARAQPRLREPQRPDSRDPREGRRRPRARGALRPARAAGRAARAASPARPGGRARRRAGGAGEALRPPQAVPRRGAVLHLAAPARGQHVPRRRRAAADARSTIRCPRSSAPMSSTTRPAGYASPSCGESSATRSRTSRPSRRR